MSNNTEFNKSAFEEIPVVGILRGTSQDQAMKIAESYFKAGFNTLEVTMNTHHVEKIIAALNEAYPSKNIGAGTVCNTEDVHRAIGAGASFIVTPILDAEVVDLCVSQSIAIFPGAYTPTEIYKAWTLGADAVKVFPATQLGVQYIKDVLAPLNNVKLIPTGGVSLQNAKEFLNAGAYGLGMGSSLFDKKMIAANDYAGLYRHMAELKSLVQQS